MKREEAIPETWQVHHRSMPCLRQNHKALQCPTH